MVKLILDELEDRSDDEAAVINLLLPHGESLWRVEDEDDGLGDDAHLQVHVLKVKAAAELNSKRDNEEPAGAARG